MDELFNATDQQSDKKIYYAGIGSRKTPAHIIKQMEHIGVLFAKMGFVLRSGGADGADAAFERGCKRVDRSLREIWLPWPKFNKHNSVLCSPTDQAKALARTVHPNGKNLKYAHLQLHARNMHQILGEDLKTPVRFVVCWTPDACEDQWSYSFETGGTGSAIACADKHGIPVFNLCNEDRFTQLINFVKEIK